MFFAQLRLCFKDFVAEGDEITGRTPIHDELRFVFQKYT